MGYRTITLAVVLVALLLLPAAASAQMPGGPPAPPASGGCPASTSGPVTLVSVETRMGSGAFRDQTGRVCIYVTYYDNPDLFPYVSYSLSALSPLAPGTTIRIVLRSSAAPPVYAVGSMSDADVTFAGQTITITAGTVSHSFSISQPGTCNGQLYTEEAGFNGVVPLASEGPASQARWAGTFFATNATSFSMPTVSPDGTSVSLDITGCGDGDPSTVDGFFTGFIPAAALRGLGLDAGLLDSVSDSVADELLELDDNGKAAPSADFSVEDAPAAGRATVPGTSTPAGMSIDYRLSFSSHRLTTRPDRAAIKLAKKCRSSRGKLKVVKRGKGKKATRALVCVKRT
jgi:hypothetical protein